MAVERGKRCVEDIGVSLPRLLLRALRWSLSPLPRGDSAASAAPAGAFQGRGCGGLRRLPAPACGNCAQGELLLRIMAGAERVLRAAACAGAAAEADRGADAPHRGRAAFGAGGVPVALGLTCSARRAGLRAAGHFLCVGPGRAG